MLVLAPLGRDAALTLQLLGRAGIDGLVCTTIDEVCRRIDDEGAAGVLLAEETLAPAALAQLVELLARQPAWSDLPIVVFSSPEGSLRRITAAVVARLGNVTLIDRPVRPITMISAARAALRVRNRQYALRDELAAQQLAVRRRDEFLAMLGHELRNPLSAILMAQEVRDCGAIQPDKYRAILRRQSQHLARLVDDLLDVSRVTSGKIALHPGPVELGELAHRVAGSLEAASRAHGVDVEVTGADRPVVVAGDTVRLEQVVVNLVSNAIKYTPRGGGVAITIAADGGDAVLEVEDDGVGIAAEIMPSIFDLFAQAPSTLDRARGGLGIGLTLVRSVVELHGGTITAASDGIGRGSRFTLRLPRRDDAEQPAGATGTAAPAARTTRAVLVVEDNPDSRDLLRALLEDLGHRVEIATDGHEALDRAGDAEVLVVDIGLPGIDGYEVARRVRAARGRSVYLIALTGYGQPDDRRRALDAGFDLHFTKPVDPAALCRVLDRPDLTALDR